MIDRLIDRFERLEGDALARTVAVGECGLDYRPGHDRERQRSILDAQLQLAVRLSLPVVLHCVHAHHDLLRLLDQHSLAPSMIHSFTGSPELARSYVERGHFVSFSGSVCNPRSTKTRAAAREVGAAHLLIETDSPDQTPLPHRPAINEPAFVRDVADTVARLRDATVESIAALTHANALRFMRIGGEG
jgi:TatD DNase family protein